MEGFVVLVNAFAYRPKGRPTMPYRDRYQDRHQIVTDIEADRGDGVDED